MNTLSTLLGGIGLFLLGMILMTDGLKTMAGDRLRQILSRFTGGSLSAISSGAAITAVIQSSSATTLTVIGFVSAGLLTFRQATGLIFGANLGTTSTSWIVSMIGLKLKIGLITLPLIGVGVLIKLFSREKYAALGMLLAGFGLVFVGIDTLQTGMKDFTALVDPAQFAGPGLGNKLILVVVGSIMTIVMQSSSAAIATTLVALSASAITLDQAVALVIGQNIGTTVTAALAAIGGTVAAKRTALAHILFNFFTGAIAFISIPVFIFVVNELTVKMGITDLAVALAIFHTLFNIIGILLLGPFIGPYTNMISKLVPDKGANLTKYLDSTVAKLSSVAVEAARRTVVDITVQVLTSVQELLEQGSSVDIDEKLQLANAALMQTKRFVAQMTAPVTESPDAVRYLSLLHAMDHLDRIIEVVTDEENIQLLQPNAVQFMLDRLQGEITKLVKQIKDGLPQCNAQTVGMISVEMAQLRKERRANILQATASGEINPEAGAAEINQILWLDRIAYHVWRIVYHLDECN